MALQICWLYAQCGYSGSRQCCHGIRAKHLLLGCKSPVRAKPQTLPIAPLSLNCSKQKRSPSDGLSRSSHRHFYPITVTHTLKQPKHIRPKGTTSIPTVSGSSATAQPCYISVSSQNIQVINSDTKTVSPLSSLD